LSDFMLYTREAHCFFGASVNPSHIPLVSSGRPKVDLQEQNIVMGASAVSCFGVAPSAVVISVLR
jgi:hypothetical protein